MASFKAFRNEFGYAHYSEQRTPVMLDIPITVVIYVCVLISIAFLVAAAGIRGKERWNTLIRLGYSLLIGSVVLVSIYGHSWQIAYKDIRSSYIYRSDGNIDGNIGIKIGLYTVNITLSGNFKGEGNKVDYNEEVVLEDISGPMTELYHALDRGLPEPILMVLEYFDIDEGGLRLGRSCKLAGYIAGILLWTALACWIAANIILCSVVWYGAFCFTFSGVCMILTILVYHYLNQSLGFRLPGSRGDVQLRYGWCLWSNLILGILTTLLGIVMIMADYKYPQKVASFFLLETALEDHHEDYSYRKSAPLVQDNKNNGRGHSATLQQHLKYGFDSNPHQNETPLIRGSNSDVSPRNGSDEAYTSCRRLSKIKDDTSSVNSAHDVVQRDNTLNVHHTNCTLNRLREIRLDIEGNVNDMKTCKPSAADKSMHITSEDTIPVIIHTENNTQRNDGTEVTHFTNDCEVSDRSETEAVVRTS